MNDRDRLITAIKEINLCNKNDCVNCLTCKYEDIADRILADGWIKPPCQIGQTVYVVRKGVISEMTVKYMYVSHRVNRMYASNETEHYNFRPKDMGKTVFLTSEEAERVRSASNGR